MKRILFILAVVIVLGISWRGKVIASSIGNGDVNNDGIINAADAILILQKWFTANSGNIDQFADGQVNSLDMAVVTANWTIASPSPSPSETIGMPFGPFNYENTPAGNVFTGGQTWLTASNAVATLNLARTHAAHIQVHLNGNHQNFVNSDGSFSLSLWESQLDAFLTNLGHHNKATGIALIQSYIDDGTIIGHFMIDEPQDTIGNWGGHPFNTADIEAAAAYSKAYWPNLATGVGSHPDYLLTVRPVAGCTTDCYPHLDYTSSPYTCKQGDVLTWENTHISAAQQLGLRIAMSLNVVNGGCGSTPTNPVSMTAIQLSEWGQMFLADTYNSMLTLYQYDTTYFSQPDIDSAVTQLSTDANNRTGVHSLLK